MKGGERREGQVVVGKGAGERIGRLREGDLKSGVSSGKERERW